MAQKTLDWDVMLGWDDDLPTRRTRPSRSAAKRRTENTLMFLACAVMVCTLFLIENRSGICSFLGLESAEVKAMHTETAAELVTEGIRRGETTVPLGIRIDSVQFSNMRNAVLQQFADEKIDLFWARFDKQDISGETVVNISSYYPDRIPAEKGYACSKLYADTVLSVQKNCPPDATDEEKVVYVHDWIVRRCSYDKQGAENAVNGLCSTAYACIVEGSAICSGYSRAFCVLMKELDMEAGYVSGWGLSKDKPNPRMDNGHAWNYVIVDGERLYVDVTWDDPLTESGAEPKYIRHTYCMMTKEEIEANHVFY